MHSSTPNTAARFGLAWPLRLHGSQAGDIRGGLTAGLLTLVTTIAYSAAAGAAMGAQVTSSAVLSGLVGAGVGGSVAALLSPIGVQVHGPRASVALVVAAAAVSLGAQLGPGATLPTLAWLSVCLILAALLQAAFGMLRLGGLIRLVPRSVSSGFAVGIAIELAWSQRASLWPASASLLDGAGLVPLAAGLATLALIVWMQTQRRVAALRAWSVTLGFALGIGLCAALQAAAAVPLALLPAVDPQARPLISLLRVFDLAGAGALTAVLPWAIGWALVIAFVNSLETLTCGLTLEARLAQRFDANHALIASALGSLASACVGGLPVAGGAAASIANVEAGARTRRSSLLAAAATALHAALLWVPLAALAGVTLAVAWALASQPVRELLLPWKEARSSGRWPALSRGAGGDLAVAAVVALLLVTAGIAAALVCGMLAASMLCLAQLRRGVVRRHYEACDAGDEVPAAVERDAATARLIRVVEIGQPLLFANVEPVVQTVEAQARDARFVIVDLARASAVDASAARTLADCRLALHAAGKELLIVRPAARAARRALFDRCPTFDRLADAIGHGMAALQSPPPAAEGVTAADDETQTQRAARPMLPHVGPIAPILAVQAERESTRLDHVYRLLSQQLPSPQACRAFLDAAGQPAASLTTTTGETR
jgi:sulfate permease, SulP family